MKKSLFFAGIGSRNTPKEYLTLIEEIAFYLLSLNYTLRSGHAEGADSAFENIYSMYNGDREIWIPWKNFRDHTGIGYFPNEKHFNLGPSIHPAWDRLPRYAKYLHARNVGQILGKDCNTPVEFVVCYTNDGCESDLTRTSKTGGTGTAISLASKNNIPVFNLKNPDAVDRLNNFLKINLSYPGKFNRFYDHEQKVILPKDIIFVFGSNLKGIHGAGAALEARRKYGAILGQGSGLQGNSYAIPTKDENLKSLPLRDIIPYIDEFVEYTKKSDQCFYLTPVGTGLANFSHSDIAPFFKGVERCLIPEKWIEFLF